MQSEENFGPQFRQIDEIFVIKHRIAIVYKILQTLHYVDYLNAYRIAESRNQVQQVITLDDLIFPHSLPVFIVNRYKYVLLLNHEHTEFYG